MLNAPRTLHDVRFLDAGHATRASEQQRGAAWWWCLASEAATLLQRQGQARGLQAGAAHAVLPLRAVAGCATRELGPRGLRQRGRGVVEQAPAGSALLRCPHTSASRQHEEDNGLSAVQALAQHATPGPDQVRPFAMA